MGAQRVGHDRVTFTFTCTRVVSNVLLCVSTGEGTWRDMIPADSFISMTLQSSAVEEESYLVYSPGMILCLDISPLFTTDLDPFLSKAILILVSHKEI